MNKFSLSIKILAIIIFAALNSTAQDVSKVGTTAAKFLSIPVSPRAIAMGGAFVSLSNDASSLYWNPAGSADINGYDVQMSRTDWIAELRHTYSAIVISNPDLGAVGVSVVALTMPEMEVTNENFPEGTGEMFSASSYSFGLSYARKLTEWFSIGATGKYIQEGIYNSRSSSFAVDIGTLFTTPFSGIRLGVAISNFGSKMQIIGSDLLVTKDIDETQHGNNPSINAYLGTDKFDLPLTMRISVSGELIKSEDQVLTLAVDASHPNDNVESVCLGAEYIVLNGLISLRAGRQYLANYEQKYAVGGGTKYELTPSLAIKVDYAFSSFGRLKNIQTFSVGFLF